MPPAGTATPIPPGMIARAREGLRYVIGGVTPSTWFGPFQPLAPQAPPEVAGRQFDYPVGYNLETRPRADAPISFAQLRALADSCDLVRTVTITAEEYLPGTGSVVAAYANQPRLSFTPNTNAPAPSVN